MKTVKLNQDTIDSLNRIKGYMINRDAKNHSYDDVVNEISIFYEFKGIKGLKNERKHT